MKISDILKLIEREWPQEWAETWDYPGLQLAGPDMKVSGIGIALDWTPEAKDVLVPAANLILTHHPLFFNEVRGLRDSDPREALLRASVKQDLTVWTCHTNLDSAPDRIAVSRALADAMQLKGGRTLRKGITDSNPQGGYGWAVPDQGLTLQGLSVLYGGLPGFQGAILNYDMHKEGEEEAGSIAFWGGSWDQDYMSSLQEQGISTLVAGEVRYHDQDELRMHGIRTHMIGHDVSETPAMHVWAEVLREKLAEEGVADLPVTVYNQWSAAEQQRNEY